MRIAVANALKVVPKALIIPVEKTSNTHPAFSHLAEWAGIDSQNIQADFQAEVAEIQVIYTSDTKFFLLGLGEKPDTKTILKAFRTLSHKYPKKLPHELGIFFPELERECSLEQCTEAAVNGLVLGTYNIGQFKTENGNHHPLGSEEASLTIFSPQGKIDSLQKAAEKGLATAETQMAILHLVNAPSNKKVPQDLANWAVQSGEQYGYRVEVWDKYKIEEIGLQALLSVNRGSEHPPVFIIMEYKPDRNNVPKVGLVGKGVTFDTGGLSIKPSTNMHYMKSDMGGAAAVLGTMELAAKLQLPVHLIGIVPSTDNSVDSLSIKPSDVIDSYSGKTIEIIDTDAEGRLILADGLAYMTRHFEPEVLIDLATLTGSAVRTLGYHAGALFSNNETLEQQLRQAGQTTGEQVWPLPIWKVYEEDLKSDVADVRNYSGRPLAGAIGAAKFLEVFIGEHKNWAHLDIAGVAFGDSEFSTQKSATAFGIRLLIEYLSKLESTSTE